MRRPEAQGEAFETLVAAMATHGADKVIAIAREMRTDPFTRRCKMALFFAGVRGHRPDALRPQPWGAVGECSRCGCILKVPASPAAGEPAIDGRALDVECPASGARRG